MPQDWVRRRGRNLEKVVCLSGAPEQGESEAGQAERDDDAYFTRCGVS